MAAVIGAVRHGMEIRQDEIGSTSNLYGDKAVAEGTIRAVAQFMMDEYATEAGAARSKLRDLTISPLTRDEIGLAIQLIKDMPFILVVPDEMNRDPAGGTLVARRMTIDLTRETTLIGVDRTRIEALRAKGRVGSVKAIGITQQACKAIERHARSLNDSAFTHVVITTTMTSSSRPFGGGTSYRALEDGDKRQEVARFINLLRFTVFIDFLCCLWYDADLFILFTIVYFTMALLNLLMLCTLTRGVCTGSMVCWVPGVFAELVCRIVTLALGCGEFTTIVNVVGLIMEATELCNMCFCKPNLRE